ncbi:topoisomerase DNA-binding C4 zinc finger domain-containing protein [Maridesulfovibrio sp.]|uniref:helix-hairpin-helix domain-containing protein n=1 Tax=Maridesulfovibrio sp. TaxID=2795000 RepID=UPI002AA826C7|nr:topoisomerase DNA-binding C4 zinc finger domain-containing protein [Maridesulfovibrio sp.]
MHQIVIGKNRGVVSELIGKGGEGEVYAVKGFSGQAVKIYNTTVRAKREEKVRAMVRNGLAVKTELVAYPNEVVTDLSGKFLGFAMRFVQGYRPLHELYSPKSRQQHFPKADYRFIVRAALNIARAVENVHQTGGVIGDLNHSGVLMAQNATVALIDADSFQFNLNGVSYPCAVGVPEFTPPELQGKNLASIQRSIEHDNFGLAVAIFHLLFMGRHPYAGRYSGSDISMCDAIAQNRFAFSLTRQATTQTTPPPGTLTLGTFPNAIAHRFENAFGLNPSARPSAREWIHALNSLEGSLGHCSKIKTHYYPSSAEGCVWCKLASSSGFDMFPSRNSITPHIQTDTYGTKLAIQEILNFRFPIAANVIPVAAMPHGASKSLQKAKSKKKECALLGLFLIGSAIAGAIYAITAWFVWGALAIWGWSTFFKGSIDSRPFLQAFKKADEKVQCELTAFVQRNGMSEIIKIHADLETTIAVYKEHDHALARAITEMKSNRKSRQRQAYLDRFPIRNANISGIGPAKTATLISFGIETAADVNRAAVLRVPGFGKVMSGKLVTWRQRIESQFTYNPAPNSHDIAEKRILHGRFAAEKAKLESIIRNGLVSLRNAKTKLDALPAKAIHDKALTDAVAARAQAEQDLRELNVSIPASTVKLAAQPKQTPPPRTPRVSTSIPTRISTTSGTPNCPHCGSIMRQRTGRYGQFWGCSRYPICKGTKNI